MEALNKASAAFSKTLNESPSEKEGKFITPWCIGEFGGALNESPSEKEGKLARSRRGI